MTRLMDLQNKQDNLFSAFQKSENQEMKEIWAEKWRNISHIIQNISYEQAKEDIRKKESHICEAIGIRLQVLGGNKNKIEIGVYDLETGNEVTFGELISKFSRAN
jgi:hypothetical protein